jgi:hypothetical protein
MLLMQTRRTKAPSLQNLLKLYECGSVKFSGDPQRGPFRQVLQ